jgi:hypothetical protein
MPKFVFNGFEVREKCWLDEPRSQITVKINKESLDQFKLLMKSLNRPCTLGFDCLISLLEDEDNLKKFVEKVKNS